MDMVFILRQLQKKCREQNKGLCATFVALTQSAGKVHGGFLGVLAVPENSPTWCFNCTKTNAAKSDSTETRQSPYSYPMAWSRVVSLRQPSSASFSAWCLSTPLKTWMMRIASTSVPPGRQSVQSMAPARPHQDPGKADPRWRCPCCPHRTSKSKPPLQMLLSSLALRLASRRQRSFTSPCPRKNTTRPPSPSATQSWNQLSNSPSWAAPSHPMPWSTRKLTTDWQRRTLPLVDSTRMCGTKRAWK